MTKIMWRKNFEITRTHLQMGSPALYDMISLQKPTISKTILNEAIWIQKGNNNIGTYFKKTELRELIDKTLEVIINNPKKINNVHNKTIKYNKDLFAFAKELLKKDLQKLTNKQLAIIYNQFTKIFIISHGYSLPSTWFLDSDGEDFSKYIYKKVEDKIVEENSSLNPAEVFSTLTTPLKFSLAVKEEIESLKILDLINKNKKAKNIFLNKKNISLKSIDSKILRKIILHYKNWRWQAYTYMGPAYNMDYYLEVWSGLLKQKINIKKELNNLLKQQVLIKKEKEFLFKQLNINPQLKSILKIATDIIYLKSFRKDAWFFTCYAMEGLYKEIGKRLDLSLNQVWFMSYDEVCLALKKGYFSVQTINERMKFCIYHQKGEKSNIYIGKKAN